MFEEQRVDKLIKIRPISALAILTDGNRSFKPLAYEQTFLGTQLIYLYKVYKLIDYSDQELEQSNNPFAIAISAAKLALLEPNLNEFDLFDRSFGLARRLLEKKIRLRKNT